MNRPPLQLLHPSHVVPLFTALFTLSAVTSMAQDNRSAYRALFVASKEAASARLVGISGELGTPQPPAWRFLYADPSARGGVKELVVKAGSLESVRTPLRGFENISSRPAIDLTKLSVDSDQAFRITNAEAVQARIAFHSMDYSLEQDAAGSPVWTLTLRDTSATPIGTTRISASSGEVLSPIRLPTAASPSPTPIGGLIGDVRDLGVAVARKTSNVVLRSVGTVQEVLTGRRTIGPSSEDTD